MATVNTTLIKVSSIGSNKFGDKKGYFKGVTKAAKNDLINVVGIKQIVKVSSLIDDTTGDWETHTVDGTEIKLTSANTGTISGEIIYR